MPRLSATALACLALAAGGALAGCGSDDSKDTSSTPAAPPPAASSKPSDANEVKVTMKNIKFVPEAITAKVGQKIVWENTDTPPHTVTASSGATFDSGNMAPGDTFDYTPKKAGTIAYFCQIHAGQKGTITVTK
jgi:plastocyanin